MTVLFFCIFFFGEIDEEIRPYDEIVLKSGGSFKGLIKEEDNQKVKIALLGSSGTIEGTSIFFKQNIEEIRRRRTVDQIYAGQCRTRNLMDADQLFEIAQWCAREDVGLKQEAVLLAHRVLRLDPANKAVYPLLDTLLAGASIDTFSLQEKDRDIELVTQARQHGIFIGESFLRTAEILLRKTGQAQRYFSEEAVALLQQVQQLGTAEQAKRALEKLIRVYLRLDAVDRLMAVLAQAPEELQTRYRPEVVTRLLLSGRQKDLEKANELIKSFPEGRDRDLLIASVSWLRGDVAKTEALLYATIEKAQSEEAAMAYALLLALQGKRRTAEAVAKLVDVKNKDAALLNFVLSKDKDAAALTQAENAPAGFTLLACEAACSRGDLQEAGRIVDQLLNDRGLGPSMQALLWVLAARIHVQKNEPEKAVPFLYCAAEAMPHEGRIPLALAELYIQKSNSPLARKYLERAKKAGAPAAQLQLAEAYFAYCRGELENAEKISSRSLTAGGLSEKELRYASRLQHALWETNELQVWDDSFDRADSRDVLRSWNEEENFGVRIELVGGKVKFSGTQRAAAKAVTLLSKTVDWDRFIRARFKVRMLSGNAAFGVLASDEVNTVRIEGDGSGTFQLVTARRDREETEPLPFSWTRNAVMEITLSRSTENEITITCNGKPHTLDRRVRFRRGGTAKIGVFARALSSGAAVNLDVESARFWRLSKMSKSGR